jgi:hypothetical protein
MKTYQKVVIARLVVSQTYRFLKVVPFWRVFPSRSTWFRDKPSWLSVDLHTNAFFGSINPFDVEQDSINNELRVSHTLTFNLLNLPSRILDVFLKNMKAAIGFLFGMTGGLGLDFHHDQIPWYLRVTKSKTKGGNK